MRSTPTKAQEGRCETEEPSRVSSAVEELRLDWEWGRRCGWPWRAVVAQGPGGGQVIGVSGAESGDEKAGAGLGLLFRGFGRKRPAGKRLSVGKGGRAVPAAVCCPRVPFAELRGIFESNFGIS